VCAASSQTFLRRSATRSLAGSEPPITGRSYPDSTDWWNYLLTIPAPRVVVLEDMDRHPVFKRRDFRRCCRDLPRVIEVADSAKPTLEELRKVVRQSVEEARSRR
jgi:hypothetical protein